MGFATAFYPCCANDIQGPRTILRGLVEEIIFCDLNEPNNWDKHLAKPTEPKVTLLQGNVLHLVDNFPAIDVLFYRNDSRGEAGSDISILGKDWMGRFIKNVPETGGLIITDGSNSRGHLFKKMIRPNGYTRESWGVHFQLTEEQPWLDEHGLYKIEISPILPTETS
jgi:hypothetical protein